MKKFLFVFSAVLFVFTMAFVSCKKSDSSGTTPAAADTSSAAGNDHTVAMQSLGDADNNSQNNMSQSGSSSSSFVPRRSSFMDGPGIKSAASDSITLKDTLFVHNHFRGPNGDSVAITAETSTKAGVATMDFGTHGLVRRGLIINHFRHKFHDLTFVDTITFSNYSYNGLAITGSVILARATDSTFTRKHNIKITYADGTFTADSGLSTRTYSGVAGASMASPNGHSESRKIKEVGVSAGVSHAQVPVHYTAIIADAKPLVFDFSCPTAGGSFPVSGVIKFSSTAYKNDRIFDFGAGTCDRTYTVTIGNVVTTVNK